MRVSALFLLTCVSLQSSGAIIFISGQPSPLEFRNELYYLPLNFVISPEKRTLFITMDGVNKVCFFDEAPEGMLEQISEISIIMNGIKTEWNCFPYETTIYEVRQTRYMITK